MKLRGRLSASYPVERGMKQGSVLSPALFLLVVDALLRSYITNCYAGGFMHDKDSNKFGIVVGTSRWLK